MSPSAQRTSAPPPPPLHMERLAKPKFKGLNFGLAIGVSHAFIPSRRMAK